MTTPIKPSSDLAHEAASAIEDLAKYGGSCGRVASALARFGQALLDEREAAPVAEAVAGQDPPLTTMPRSPWEQAEDDARATRQLVAGIKLERDVALTKLTASEARCKELEGELESTRQTFGDAFDRTVAELRAELVKRDAVMEAAREHVGFWSKHFACEWVEPLAAALSALDASRAEPVGSTPESPDSSTRPIVAGDTVRCDFGNGRGALGTVLRVDSSQIPYLVEYEAIEVVKRETWMDARGVTLAPPLVEDRADPAGERAIVVGSVWRHIWGYPRGALGSRTVEDVDAHGLGHIKLNGISGTWGDNFRTEWEWVSDPPAVSESATGEG